MRAGLVLLVVGCGRIAFDPRDVTRDAVMPGTLGPWSMPALVTELVSGAADDPSLTADQLQIFFASTRSGGLGSEDIWVATRSDITQPFSTPANVTAVNSSEFDTTPKITPDGLTLYFASQRPGGLGDSDIWRSTRATLASPWTAPINVAELNSAVKDESLSVDACEWWRCLRYAAPDRRAQHVRAR